jgi:hypothetical protein
MERRVVADVAVGRDRATMRAKVVEETDNMILCARLVNNFGISSAGM